jgi:hypothetical protein
VLLLGVGLLALKGTGSGGNRGATTADPSGSTAPSASTPASAAASAGSSPAASQPSAAAPAEGTYTDPAVGWRIAVPSGWTRKTVAAGTRFTDPSSGDYVLVATRYPAGPSAVGAWRDSERSFRSSHDGYERIRLETIEGDDARGAKDAADWEFRYSEGGAVLHALDRAMVFGNRGYAVYVQSHDSDWDSRQDLFDAVQASFRPGS